uniref:Uncharacterized protein n=1 Tax=Capra hircus TaxID=9925 RepID=A0A452FIJ3_CAPHI
VCVFWGVGWVLAGVGLLGVWEGLGERWRMKSPAPFLNSQPHKPGREGAYSRCRVSCRCAKMGVGGGRVPGRAAPRVALSKQYSSSCLGDGKTGERVGLGTWGVFSVWYPLWASLCV